MAKRKDRLPPRRAREDAASSGELDAPTPAMHGARPFDVDAQLESADEPPAFDEATAEATQAGEDEPFTNPIAGTSPSADGILPRSVEDAMPAMELGSDALSEVDVTPWTDPGADRSRAVMVGLLIGIAVGLLIDAVLSNWLLQGM